MIDILNDYKKKGKTLLTTTHDLSIVPTLATRVVIFGEERTIVADGPSDVILSQRKLLIDSNLLSS
jgi:cobalt/nickel transport system ATP-binding protein